jgi:5'-3' exonuclease
MTDHLLLFDANGFAHRAYHAMAPSTRASDGMPTNAVLGFMNILWRTLGRASADPFTHAATVFDAGGKTYRHTVYKDYKANRTPKEALNVQLPLMREASRSLGIEPMEVEGFEADDVLATLARMAKERGARTTIVTVDKDLAQLVEDGVVEIADPIKHVRLMAKHVEEIWGVQPDQVTFLQALMGDSADNIPGVQGVGAKTALEIVKRFTSIGHMIEALDGPAPRGISRRIWFALRKARPMLPIYHKLVTLRSDVPMTIVWDTFVPQTVTKDHLLDFLRLLEAENRFDNLFGQDQRLFRRAEPIPDPYAWWRAELKRPGQRIPEDPQCGWYKRRLVRKGPYVACRIWREPEVDFETGRPSGKDTLNCEVAAERADAMNHWGYLCRTPISEADYKHMIELAQWARLHAKHEPEASPFCEIDWSKVPL